MGIEGVAFRSMTRPFLYKVKVILFSNIVGKIIAFGDVMSIGGYYHITMQTGSSSKYILAYDAKCGPCTKTKRIVDILDKYEKIDFISLTKADQEGLLDKIPVHQRYKSFHLIFPKGDAKSGSEALLELIIILPGGKIIS